MARIKNATSAIFNDRPVFRTQVVGRFYEQRRDELLGESLAVVPGRVLSDDRRNGFAFLQVQTHADPEGQVVLCRDDCRVRKVTMNCGNECLLLRCLRRSRCPSRSGGFSARTAPTDSDGQHQQTNSGSRPSHNRTIPNLPLSPNAGSAALSTRWDVSQSPWRDDDGKVMEHRGGLPPSCASEHPLADSCLSR